MISYHIYITSYHIKLYFNIIIHQKQYTHTHPLTPTPGRINRI